MPTRTGQTSIQRLQAISLWLQAGASASSVKHLDHECAVVAELVEQEHRVWLELQAACSYIEAGSPARLCALLSALAAFAHLPGAVADFPVRSGRQQLYSTLLSRVAGLLKCSPPPASQLALAKALLCSNVLHGLSRQLSTLSEGLVSLPAARQPAARPPPPTATPQEALLVEHLYRSLTLTARLAGAGYECIQGDPAAADANPDGRRRQWRNPYECQPDAKSGGAVVGTAVLGAGCRPEALAGEGAGGEVQAQEGAAAPEGEPQAGVQASALFVQELVAAFCSSGLVEHASRGMLLLAGRLQQLWAEQGTGGGAGRDATAGQQQQQHPLKVLRQAFTKAAVNFTGTYQYLSILTSSPGLLGAPTPTAAAAHRLDPATVAPLSAAEHQMDPEHLDLLRRVLSGPCIRHLVLCMGLRALCELDGGPTYGLPEAAGLKQLPLAVLTLPENQDLLVLQNGPLHNLITLLAMLPYGEEEGAQGGAAPASCLGGSGTAAAAAPAARSRGGVEPLGRGTRLQLTLRVARAVAAAAARARNRGAFGGPTCAVVEPANDAEIAVQALHFAWRHVPPPPPGRGCGGGGGGRRRRAALQQWAAVAAEVACSAPVVRPTLEEEALQRLGLLLGLHPSVVGHLSPEDLPILAFGGHLHRGAEALVRQFASGLEQGAPCPSSSCPAPLDVAAAAIAVSALASAIYLRGGLDAPPLAHLLLMPAAQPREGGGDGGAGSGGRGGSVVGAKLGVGAAAAAAAAVAPRAAAASLAVALGKLLWRCEAQLAVTITLGREAALAETELLASAVLQVLRVVHTLCCMQTDQAGGGGDGGDGERGGADGDRGLQGAAEAGGGVDGGEGQQGDAEQGLPGGTQGHGESGEVWEEEAEEEEEEQGDSDGQSVDVGRRQEEQEGDQEGEQEPAPQVWAFAYGAWRWLPALSSLARRTVVEAGGYGQLGASCVGHALLVWEPLLTWVQRLCLAYLRRGGAAVGETEAAAGAGVRGAAGSDVMGRARDGAPCAGCAEGDGSSSCCGEGGGGRWGGCWRAFLLHDLGAVELVGMALRELVPALLRVIGGLPRQHEGVGGAKEAGPLRDVAAAVVLLAAAFPDEVARAAWGPEALCPQGGCREESGPAGGGRSGSDGGSDGGSGSDGTCSDGGTDDGGGELRLRTGGAWSATGLAALAEQLRSWGDDAAHPVMLGLRAVGDWAEGCREVPLGPSAEQRAALAEAAEGLRRESDFQSGLEHVLPLCELRALLRVCSNPGCVVLPPPGHTEAEAAEGAKAEVAAGPGGQAEAEAGAGVGRLQACPGGCGAAWYCCRECRAEHWRAGHGEGCRGVGDGAGVALPGGCLQ